MAGLVSECETHFIRGRKRKSRHAYSVSSPHVSRLGGSNMHRGLQLWFRIMQACQEWGAEEVPAVVEMRCPRGP